MRDRYLFPFLVLLLVDICVFGGAVLLAYDVRFSSWFTETLWATPPGSPPPVEAKYWELALYAVAIGLIILERFGFYSHREGLNRGVRPVAFVLAVVVCYVFLMAWLFLYVHSSYSHSRLVIFLSILFTIGLGLASQVALRQAMRAMVTSGVGFNRTVLVGSKINCREILDQLRSAHGSVHQVVGFIGTGRSKPEGLNGTPFLGSLEDVPGIFQEHHIDRVILALPGDQDEQAWKILDLCKERDIDCRITPDLFETMTLKVDVAAVDGLPVITLGDTPLSGTGQIVKQAMDLVIASVALVVISPVMLLFSILIKLDSEGPVLFKQERIGSDGRNFNMFKFRTMHKDAEKNTGPVWAKANDPRCTRVGRWLRRTNLDELPQIFNVLRGEMSLVGPRPERSYFVNKFKRSIPRYMRRHVVKSGVTGWAQVNGWRGNTSVEERTKCDIFYIENWSVLFDLKILLRTLVANKNAY